MANQLSRAATKRREQKVTDAEEGRRRGIEWARTARPTDVVLLLQSMGWQGSYSVREPWRNCPISELCEILSSKKPEFGIAFLEAVRTTFQSEYSALIYLRHGEGRSDGLRWRTEFATEPQLKRLEQFAAACEHRTLFKGDYSDETWTPAHELVSFVWGDDYPKEGRKPSEDCPVFRDFWKPFVAEPMDEVLAWIQACDTGHKLQDPHYIAGFVDGALGLSQKLEQRLKWPFTPTRPSEAEPRQAVPAE